MTSVLYRAKRKDNFEWVEGYYVPRLYRLTFYLRELKEVGFLFVKERLKGYSIWYVTNEEDYIRAVETLNELKKTRLFDFKVSE